MRLVILSLDGLDPNLVELWKMEWFKQKSWGKHYVGLFNKLYTPILWSCFLTGLNVERHGYSLSELKEKRSKDAFRSQLIYKLYLLRKRIPIKKLGLRRLLIKLGLADSYPASTMPEHLLEKTFLEELKAMDYNIVAIEVPGYNETRNEYYRSRLTKLATAPFLKRADFIKEALEDTTNRIAEATEYVKRDYDLVFVYSPLPDIAFHMAVKPNLSVKLWLSLEKCTTPFIEGLNAY